MVQGSVVRPTETMNERDSMNAFIDGSKKAACAARELAAECDNPEWATVATTLDAMRDGAQKLFDMRAMSRLETLMAANLKTKPYQPH